MIGSDFCEYFTEPEKAREGYKAVYAEGFVIDYPLTIRHVSGAVTYVLYNATVYRDKTGHPAGVFAAARDISERKLAEEQLEIVNGELEAFAYSVSHDLRAPLRGIDGWSLALLEDYGNPLDQKASGYLDIIRSETQRMGRLIDDLLQLSRLGRAELKREPVDLSAIAQAVAARLRQVKPEREIEFVIQPGLTAQGDASLLEIVLTNLLDNACKFTGSRPVARIEFCCSLEPDPSTKLPITVFLVRDNGVGFDTAHAQKLFGAFQRMHKTSEFPGTGIGLATVQRIVHRHQGRIWTDAQTGRGATFYFTLGTAT